MNDETPAQLAPLKDAIGDILLARLEPVSEFELIKTLQKPPYGLLNEHALQGNLNLFQTHFLVFHCLYLLRIDWVESELGFLRIEPLSIGLEPVKQSASADSNMSVANPDPLAHYYLDLSHLSATTEADVLALIDGFWSQMQFNGRAVSADERSQALVVMDLGAMPGSEQQLKREFRRRVHQVHPDKGGSAKAMQELQWAYHIIQNALVAGVSSH